MKRQRKETYIAQDWRMMDQSYLWHQTKPQDQNGLGPSTHSMSNAPKPANGIALGAHGHGAGNGVQWGNEYGYINGTPESIKRYSLH